MPPVGPLEATATQGRPGDEISPAGTLRHVAVIMDGNGRWAQARRLPRSFGHRAGSHAVRRTVRAAAEAGLEALTLYAFSCDNWARPQGEVNALMELLQDYLDQESSSCVQEGIRLSVFGRRDRLHPSLLRAIEVAEQRTSMGRRLHLRLAVDYSGRDAILAAASRCPSGEPLDPEAFQRSIHEASHSPLEIPEVDLLIRTGGEKRLSDFLLWESAYAELYFTDCLWPDFNSRDLTLAIDDFSSRERRFGSLPASANRRPDRCPRTPAA